MMKENRFKEEDLIFRENDIDMSITPLLKKYLRMKNNKIKLWFNLNKDVFYFLI